MSTYTLRFSPKADKLISRDIKSNPVLKSKLSKALKTLSEKPFSTVLRTHKVYTSKYGLVYSSVVSGDVRILWQISEDRVVIIILTIGGHSGKRKVYS